MPAEARLIEQIKKHIRSLGGKVIKIHQSGFSEAGTPDLLCVTKKYGTFFVETKAPGEKPTPIQLGRIAEINTAGGQAFWCDSMEGFLAAIGRVCHLA